MKKVDLNVDIGEGFPHDEALLEFATSANICCGEHAGSWELTLQTIELCKSKDVRIGSHPGFPDREHFGRRLPTSEEFEDYRQSIKDQITRFSKATKLAYIKPHGALYQMLTCRGAEDGIELSQVRSFVTTFAIQSAFDRSRTPLMLLADAKLGMLFEVMSIELIKEGFADRRYRPDGTLVPRSEPNAMLEDPEEIQWQVLELAPKVDSICLHGDTPNCLQFAELVHKTLKDAGYEVGF